MSSSDTGERPPEAVEVPPQGEGEPPPEILAYATGHKPVVQVRIEGHWRIGVVRERHDYGPGRTAYQVTLDPGTPVVRVRFSSLACRPCPHLRDCVDSPKAEYRQLTFRHHEEHQAIGQARALQQTDGWKERYKIRAGVEGTISQGVQRCGLRRSRYRGLAKTSLQHQLTGAAINLARIDAHLTDTPRARTRISHFAALRPAEPTLDGAK
ncbi:hypothetical protein ABH925_007574 [Streptacidiphilus sp. EB129]